MLYSVMGLRVGVLLALALMAGVAQAADAPQRIVRFGLTAAAVRENLDLYDRWAAYLGRKVGRSVQFIQRRSYREAMELIEVGEHDFSWICSFPYKKYQNSNFFELLVVPVFEGQPFYRSYIIVHKDSPHRSIDDLEGKVFAYSDPDSNSGYIVPRSILHDRGRNPDSFFRHTFFTYSHTETIEAVAERVADGAAVDSYVWEYLNRQQSPITARTKIIHRSEAYGFPPLVSRAGIDPELRQRMADALLTMEYDPQGRVLLEELMLDRFTTATPALYDGVRITIDRR